MKIYVFGNPDYQPDSLALSLAKHLEKRLSRVGFVTVDPNADLPFADEKEVVILDTVSGICEVTVIQDQDLDRILLSPRNSVHDFDLGFQLKYLKKLGKIGTVTIIGLPMEVQIPTKTLTQQVTEIILRLKR